MVTVEREGVEILMEEQERNGLRTKEKKKVTTCSCRVKQGQREEDDDISSPISNFKLAAHLVNRDEPALNLDTMGQDSRLGCSLLKARGLCRVRPGGSDIRDISFKGLGVLSKP